MAEVTYLEAIKQGMVEEMRRDEHVYIMGEDVAVYGGAFKVTAGLLDEFGPMRVIDKDRNPRWSPPAIEEVTPEMVAPYFAEIGADELVFDPSK